MVIKNCKIIYISYSQWAKPCLFFVWKTSILSFILYYRIFTFAYGTIIWKVLEKVS